MDVEYVMVFLESEDQENWKPVIRERIPEWLKDEELIERMIGGEAVRNETQSSPWYRVIVLKKRPCQVQVYQDVVLH